MKWRGSLPRGHSLDIPQRLQTWLGAVAEPSNSFNSMSDLAAAHRQLQDAVQSDDAARAAHKELERRYRESQQRAKKAQEAVTQALERLSKAHVTFLGLQKTQVGVDVNKLRKHEVASVQAAADKLVRSWKSVVEQHQQHHAQPRAAPRPASAAAPGGSAHRPLESRGAREGRPAQVLDSVRDENGRVERRVAHPDSHEDQLALREAEEAERMWEAQMGGGSGGGGGGGSGGGGGGGGAGPRGRWTSAEVSEAQEPRHASRAGGAISRPPPSQEQRRQAVGAQLKQRYEQLERAKKSRQLVSLETAEVPKKEKRKAEAAGSAGGSLRAKLG